MRTVPIVLFAYLLAMSAAHAEKKIYKCANADGSSVFSPYPCGAGAQEVKVETTEPSAPVTTAQPTSVPVPVPATAPASPPARGVDDGIKCIQDARLLRAYPARANLDMLLKRQAELMRNYASDTSEATRVLIGNMDAAIATEQARIDEGRQRADRAYTDAISKCEAREAARGNQVRNP